MSITPSENAPSRRGSTAHSALLEVGVGFGALGRERTGQQLGDEVAVRGEDPREHPGLGLERGDVREVPVVAEREAGPAVAAVDGLGVGPVARTARRVAHVAESEVALERREGAGVEHRGDEAHVLARR